MRRSYPWRPIRTGAVDETGLTRGAYGSPDGTRPAAASDSDSPGACLASKGLK